MDFFFFFRFFVFFVFWLPQAISPGTEQVLHCNGEHVRVLVAIMEGGRGRKWNAWLAAWLKLMGQGKEATENGHPTWLSLSHQTNIHMNMGCARSPLFNLALLMTSELDCQKRFAFRAPTAGFTFFISLCILRGSYSDVEIY